MVGASWLWASVSLRIFSLSSVFIFSLYLQSLSFVTVSVLSRVCHYLMLTMHCMCHNPNLSARAVV